MNLLEVAKHALEAMEDAMYRADTHEFYDAKESLRYAIEQAERIEQERPHPDYPCRSDGRCQYAIDSGAEGLGHCPPGKCCMAARLEPTAQEIQNAAENLALMKRMFPQPEQEPDGISWLKRDSGYFTAPTPRKPLTEEEIINIGKEAHAIEGPHILPVSFARAIERAHGIGEQT